MRCTDQRIAFPEQNSGQKKRSLACTTMRLTFVTRIDCTTLPSNVRHQSQETKSKIRVHEVHLDIVRILVEVDVSQHHAARKEDSSRVGQILASDVRRSAMHCLHECKPVCTCDNRSAGMRSSVRIICGCFTFYGAPFTESPPTFGPRVYAIGRFFRIGPGSTIVWANSSSDLRTFNSHLLLGGQLPLWYSLLVVSTKYHSYSQTKKHTYCQYGTANTSRGQLEVAAKAESLTRFMFARPRQSRPAVSSEAALLTVREAKGQRQSSLRNSAVWKGGNFSQFPFKLGGTHSLVSFKSFVSLVSLFDLQTGAHQRLQMASNRDRQ